MFTSKQTIKGAIVMTCSKVSIMQGSQVKISSQVKSSQVRSAFYTQPVLTNLT